MSRNIICVLCTIITNFSILLNENIRSMKYSRDYNEHYDHFRYWISEMAVISFPPQNYMRMSCYYYWLEEIKYQDCRATSTRRTFKSNLIKICPVILELRNMDRQADNFFFYMLHVYASHSSVSVTKLHNENWLLVVASWTVVTIKAKIENNIKRGLSETCDELLKCTECYLLEGFCFRVLCTSCCRKFIISYLM
jgi:hypothetical protein